MIVNRLLYSRSFSKDYRWVMIPSAESPGDHESIKSLLSQLNDEYDLYDRSKGVSPERDAVLLFSKSIGGYGVLCRCGPTKYEDALGRKIFALSGLLAKHEEKKEFAAALPYLVALGEEWLDSPVDLGAADADQIKNSVRTQSVALDALRERLPATAQEWLRMPHVQGMTSHEIRSEEDGLKCLLRLLGSPLVPWIDFTFATPAQLVRKMGTCDVVVGDVGLSVSGIEKVLAPPVKPPVRAGAPTHAQTASDGRARQRPRQNEKEKADSSRARSGKGRARSRPVLDSTGDPPPKKKASEQQRRRRAPILPDDFDTSAHSDTDDDGDTVRIRAVADSSYLERLLQRAYFRFEAYGTRGDVTAASERFRLSHNLERDHVAQKEALSALLGDLSERGYVRSDDSSNDWSECVLRRKRNVREQRGQLL